MPTTLLYPKNHNLCLETRDKKLKFAKKTINQKEVNTHRKKIVYCTPSLYIAGGVERVLTTKANYLADVLGYEVYIMLTDGKGRDPYFPLSKSVKVINLDIGFEELWRLSFIKKGLVYLKKQAQYKRALRKTLLSIRPEITVSLGRREVNFLCDIPDGSRKFCEIHVNRSHYRNFERDNANWYKNLFARFWMQSLVKKLKRYEKVICLTSTDAAAWKELDNVTFIPNPLPQHTTHQSTCANKIVIAVGRYTYEKGFDLLLDAWAFVHKKHPEWQLNIFGTGDRTPYLKQCAALGLTDCCHLHDAVPNIAEKYAESSILAVSSRFEGFGMIIIEAMQCGVPVVSFDCPFGPRDIITDGKDGLLVKDGDINSLATGICKMIEDDKYRKQLGEAAIETAKKYNIDQIMERWV
ncbi:MAG: glycosyltransferase family 4 protein, partial [Bacteroidaceae bacterium]|nr:glycosyltransferase family 4 protein [Bacteroidaceae bacterium]